MSHNKTFMKIYSQLYAQYSLLVRQLCHFLFLVGLLACRCPVEDSHCYFSFALTVSPFLKFGCMLQELQQTVKVLQTRQDNPETTNSPLKSQHITFKKKKKKAVYSGNWIQLNYIICQNTWLFVTGLCFDALRRICTISSAYGQLIVGCFFHVNQIVQIHM